jgi:pseudomonalisin
MQGDGNLVAYFESWAIWASGTSGNPGACGVMQTDGNLVVYSSAGNALWDSGTAGHAGAYAVMHTDGLRASAPASSAASTSQYLSRGKAAMC